MQHDDLPHTATDTGDDVPAVDASKSRMGSVLEIKLSIGFPHHIRYECSRLSFHNYFPIVRPEA